MEKEEEREQKEEVEEDAGSDVGNDEEERMSVHGHAKQLISSIQSVQTPSEEELKDGLESVAELLRRIGLEKSRQDVSCLAQAVSKMIMRAKPDRPLRLLAAALETSEQFLKPQNDLIAYRSIRFIAHCAHLIRSVPRVAPQPQSVPEDAKSKASAAEERTRRKREKAEEYSRLFGVVFRIAQQVRFTEAFMLRKLEKSLRLIAEHAVVPGPVEISLQTSFFMGMAARNLPGETRARMIQMLCDTVIKDEEGLAKAERWMLYYRPLFRTLTESEVEHFLLAQLQLLLKRSSSAIGQIAGMLKELGPITCRLLHLMLSTTFSDFLQQEASTLPHQSVFVGLIANLFGKLINAGDPKELSIIKEQLSYPWRQQLGASETEAEKQLNILKIIAELLKRGRLSGREPRQELFMMAVELFGAIKHDAVAAEASLWIAELICELGFSSGHEGGVAVPVEEIYSSLILSKAYAVCKSKDIMGSLLHPIIQYAVSLLHERPEDIAKFLPGTASEPWKAQAAQLNFNAVTLSSYNIAVSTFYLLLRYRDSLCSKAELVSDEATLLKFCTLPQSVINRGDFITGKANKILDATLQINLISVVLHSAQSYLEANASSSAVHSIANTLLHYALSSKNKIRSHSINCITKAFEHNFTKSAGKELGLRIASILQGAVFAFLKHSPCNDHKIHCLKPVLGVLLKMYAQFRDDSGFSQRFIMKQFVLIHSSRANGEGRCKQKLSRGMWETMREIPGVKKTVHSELDRMFQFLTCGSSLLSSEVAMNYKDQIETLNNIVATLGKEGLGPELLRKCLKLLRRDKMMVAEKLAEEVLEGDSDAVSHFEVEFLLEEISDLKAVTFGTSEAKPQKEVKKQGKKHSGKKQAHSGAGSKKKTLTREQIQEQNFLEMQEYAKRLYTSTKSKITNALWMLRTLAKAWNSTEVLQQALRTGLVEELKELAQYSSIRFDTYLTLNSLMVGYAKQKYLSRDHLLLSESHFISIIKSTTRDSVKRCSALFKSLSTGKVGSFDESIVLMILDIAEFLIENPNITTAVKSKVIEVVIRIMMEGNYNPVIIRRVTPVLVRLMSSVFMGENLERFLQVFWARASYNDMFDVIRCMYRYDPSHQYFLLKSIHAVKRPLPAESWMSNILFNFLFNDSRDLSHSSMLLFNERTVRLGEVLYEKKGVEEDSSNLVTMMNFRSKDVRDSAVAAIAGYSEICRDKIDKAVQLAIGEFDLIEPKCRATIASLLSAVAPLLPPSQLSPIFVFLLKRGVAAVNETSQEFMEAGIRIIQEQGKMNAGIMITAIEELLSQGKKALSDNANTIAVIFIGNLARYLSVDDVKLPKLFATLQEMLLIPSRSVRIAVAKCLSYFASIFKEQSLSLMNKYLFALQTQDPSVIPKGNQMHAQAFAIAGFVKGLGIGVIHEQKILDTLAEPFLEKASDSPLSLGRRELALYTCAALSDTLGRCFEYYGIKCMPYILQSFAAGKEVIRVASQTASKAIISKLTGQGVKTVLPTLINELDHSNWRSKLAAVECLGTMAFMAPKQLSNNLPQIVSNIKGILNDTQPKVHEAGISALTAIGSVIKNPEIADISGKIIKTLKNPTKELIYALDLLLQQSFAHAIDAPSLSLIIPILDYGLRAQNNDVKKKATQLVGSICKVIGDPVDMLPYLPVIIPALKAALFDSMPEVRSCSAKALGSLCKGLGLHNMREVISWIQTVLDNEGSPVERSGAANGYAEIIAEQGVEYLDSLMQQLIEKTRDKSGHVREGYIGLFLFLPLTFGEAFEKYFTVILPVVLQALTDPEELVRNSANRVVQICIRQYGTKRTDVLLGPLLQRMLDSEWRIRDSALNLMGELLVVLESDISRPKPKLITEQQRNTILSTLFILRYDNVETVAVASAQIWKGFVDNPPKTMKIIIQTLILEILEIFAKRGKDLVEIASFALQDIAEKYGEKLMFDILSLFKDRIEMEDDPAYLIAIGQCLMEMLKNMNYRIITEYKKPVFAMLEPYICSDEEEMRRTIASIFTIIMQKDMENDFQYRLPKMAYEKLKEYEAGEEAEKQEYLQEVLSMIVQQRPKFGDSMIHTFGEEPLNPIKLSVLTSIIDYVVSTWFNPIRSKKLLDRVFNATLIEGPIQEAAIKCLQASAEYIDDPDNIEKWVNTLMEFSMPSDNHELRIQAFLRITIHLFKDREEQMYSSYSRELFGLVVTLIHVETEPVPGLVTEAIEAITNEELKENQHGYVVRLKQEIELKRRDKQIIAFPIFNKEKALDYYLPLFQNTLMHASVEFRVEAATAYRYAIEGTTAANLKTSAAKIAGSLIRVVNDKFPFALKNELFEATYSLTKKCGQVIRAFVSPLQTTMMKAINDPELSAPLRVVIMKNVQELLKLNPKSDGLRSELFAALDSAISVVYPTALQVLALIGRMHGAQMKPEARMSVLSQLAGVSAKLSKSLDEDFAASLGYALASFVHAPPEAAFVYDFPITKLLMNTELHLYFYFPQLFSPYSQTDPKLVPNLKDKVKITGQPSFIRLIGYLQFYIPGAHAESLEVLFTLLEEWMVSVSKEGWEVAEQMLELVPFAECEAMKLKSGKYLKVKCAVLSYIAQECEFAVKEGAYQLIAAMFGADPDAIKELEKEKLVTSKTAHSICTILTGH